jgi:hypothetical protein
MKKLQPHASRKLSIIKFNMQKLAKKSLILVAILLVLNGLLNIIDDGRVLVYDIASILSGIGFAIVSFSLNKKL